MCTVESCGDRKLSGRRLSHLVTLLTAELHGLFTAAPVILLLSTAALLLQLSPKLQTQLDLRFASLSSSSAWQLASCHLLHWSWNHCVWDAVVFVTAGVFCESRWPEACRRVLCWSAALIPLVVLQAEPELLCYRGLSGLDSALFALAAAMLLQEEWQCGRRPAAAVAGLAVVCQFLKIAAEIHAGQTLFVSDRSFVPVPLSHLTGAAVGTAVAACCAVKQHWGAASD